MIGNLIIGSEKFVLFVDRNEYEPVAQRLLESIIDDKTTIQHRPIVKNVKLTETKTNIDIHKELLDLPEKSNVILSTVSCIAVQHTISDLIKLVHSLKQCSKTKQLFAWATVKNISDRKIIPFLEHMADVIVTLEDRKHLTILTKKITGSVSRKNYQYEISNNYEIIVRELKSAAIKKNPTETSVDPESLATFKINFDEDELVARNALKLPYERTSDVQKTTEPQIHYQPDSDDDFDEEDPDEDLYI